MKTGAVVIVIFAFMINISSANSNGNGNRSGEDIMEVSQQLLLQAKTHQPTDALVAAIKNITAETLSQQLMDDNAKKAFWINLYNAYTQILLSKNPQKYKSRTKFFSDKQINVAGHVLSPDDIEHGILRHSKVKWGLGYLNKWFPSLFERNNRVETIDYRIHFALNCGAKSCPPIAFYKPDKLNMQLDMATKAYLQGEAEYNEKTNTAVLPAIMSWFRGDFGNKKGMIALLHKTDIIEEEKKPAIKFKSYDWKLFLENYKSE